MSVPKSLREIPSSEFAYEAMTLTGELTSYAISLPNRLQRHIAEPISDDCHTILKHALTADAIYITCWDELRERRYHLNRVLGALHDLEVTLLRSYMALDRSYRSERSAEQIERDRLATEAMEEYFDGPYIPNPEDGDDGRSDENPRRRTGRRSKRPNPHYYELRGEDIGKLRALIKGVKKSDPDKLRKRDRQRAERKRAKRHASAERDDASEAPQSDSQRRLFDV